MQQQQNIIEAQSRSYFIYYVNAFACVACAYACGASENQSLMYEEVSHNSPELVTSRGLWELSRSARTGFVWVHRARNWQNTTPKM